MRPLLRLLAAGLLALGPALASTEASAGGARPVDLRKPLWLGGVAHAPAGPGGSDAKLTLDPALQREAERLLAQAGAHEGAIVASDTRTGRILAWASRGSRDYVSAAFAPSASLFKLATTAALLQSGKASPSTRECYTGGEHAVEPRDLEGRGTTCTTLGEALGHSVNLVFARLAKKHLSPDILRKEAQELGLSGEVPIDVAVSPSVVDIPDDPFGMARASAGFWNGRLSPLGALFAMQTIANEGERIRLSVIDHGGPTARVSLGGGIPAPVARSMTQMLELTTRRGTAAKAFTRPDGSRALPGIGVAAKTGTLIGGHPSRMYSWFAAFAPSTRPEIAVTVMLGNDLRWRTKANLVGRELLEAYFGARDSRLARSARRASPKRARAAGPEIRKR
ncbi:MAG: penicillin-binding transpeptidase domain-containing protein [Byssovorax sp.]